jgi:formate dehydrogenase assembly factor FdhD
MNENLLALVYPYSDGMLPSAHALVHLVHDITNQHECEVCRDKGGFMLVGEDIVQHVICALATGAALLDGDYNTRRTTS